MGIQIRYGMVGGHMNAFIGEVHRKAIAFDPRAQLVAGCFSTNAEKNRETGETYSLDMSRVYPSYEAMAEAESKRPDGIDFVSITTPNNTHYDVAKCFLQHGIHVVCEKPLCFTVEQGQELVALCAENGVTVQAIPGCCAAIAALAVSGLDTRRFTFEGFLPSGKKERRAALEELTGEARTMVFHEAPHRLRQTLADMVELLGDRPAALCRELTKLHEDTVRTTLAQAAAFYRDNEPRGEYVLVIAGREKQNLPALTLEEGAARVLALRDGGMKLKEAVRRVADDTGLPRNALYDTALKA